MIHKLGLGTVQFGCAYGIANKRGQVTKTEVFKILSFAHASGVVFLDTSCCYCDSEQILGEFLAKNPCSFDIVSKFSGSMDEVDGIFESSLARLKSKSLYGYLIHHFIDFKKAPEVWRVLEKLKTKRLVEKIGFSLYLPEELILLFKKKITPDIIQIPYSVFDRRFEPYFEVLKKLGVEIHVRSVFLQGLVYLNPQNLKGNFKMVRILLMTLKRIAADNYIPVSALCLNYVLLNQSVDKVIFGVDSLEHLKENIDHLKLIGQVMKLKLLLDGLAVEDDNILLPYKWQKK